MDQSVHDLVDRYTVYRASCSLVRSPSFSSRVQEKV